MLDGKRCAIESPLTLICNTSVLIDMLRRMDVLRQRVVLALSEVFVISLRNMPVPWGPFLCVAYWEMLEANCFANFRTLLERRATLRGMLGGRGRGRGAEGGRGGAVRGEHRPPANDK